MAMNPVETEALDSPSRAGAGFGPLLRYWRNARRQSQHALALEAASSSRHLSYLETGRARPSRDMVLRLATALDVPLRERNTLLSAAGYAPMYFATSLDDPGMAPVRSAIDLILAHQEPYPAFLLDRHWNIRQANRAAIRCTRFLLGGDPAESNMIRLLLDPAGMRPLMPNWAETVGELVRHLRHQVAAAPSDERATDLLADALACPGAPPDWRTLDPGSPTKPLITTVFQKDDVELRFFSTLTTFSAPRDIALDELRIECNFPADEATARACRERFGEPEDKQGLNVVVR